MNIEEKAYLALNKLAKWRTIFAGWQLGTRAKDDPESQAVRNHREATIIQRVEISALTNLLLKKGIITHTEINQALITEAEALDKAFEAKFPGCRTDQDGVHMDVQLVLPWMKNWRP